MTTIQKRALNVEITVLTKKHIEQAAYLLSTSFGMNEPLAFALDIPSHDHYTWGLQLAKQAARDGLSHVAVEKSSGMVVGVLFSSDMVGALEEESDDQITLENEPESMQLIQVLLNELDHMYEEKYGPFGSNRGTFFHFLCIAIHPDPFYLGKGLAKSLLTANINLAREKGYKTGLVECSGLFSQKMFKSFGFVEEFTVEYESWQYKGQRVLEGLEKKATNAGKLFHPSIQLMSCKLDQLSKL